MVSRSRLELRVEFHRVKGLTWCLVLVRPMWAIIRECSRWCQLHLVTSTVMEKELNDQGCKHLDVWQRGVDTNVFNPKFKSEAMRGCLKWLTGAKKFNVGHAGMLDPMATGLLIICAGKATE
eukprot:1190193-Prorocentrum_minimum.AAC.4